MTRILDRCQVTIKGVDAVGDTPAIPDAYYYFMSTHGVYIGAADGSLGPVTSISGITQIVAENSQTDYSGKLFSKLSDLVKAGILRTEVLRVRDTSGPTAKDYFKTIHLSDDVKANFDELIESDIVWPIGKGAGQKIVEAVTRRRITSRR
jgi:hypothetical protein